MYVSSIHSTHRRRVLAHPTPSLVDPRCIRGASFRFRCARGRLGNQCSLRDSSRRRLLNDSTWAFWFGLPCPIRRSCTPRSWAQVTIALPQNSLPLSRRPPAFSSGGASVATDHLRKAAGELIEWDGFQLALVIGRKGLRKSNAISVTCGRGSKSKSSWSVRRMIADLASGVVRNRP